MTAAVRKVMADQGAALVTQLIALAGSAKMVRDDLAAAAASTGLPFDNDAVEVWGWAHSLCETLQDAAADVPAQVWRMVEQTTQLGADEVRRIAEASLTGKIAGAARRGHWTDVIEWIPVAERMPNDETVVLVITPGGYVDTSYYCRGFSFSQLAGDNAPTHWADFPVPAGKQPLAIF